MTFFFILWTHRKCHTHTPLLCMVLSPISCAWSSEVASSVVVVIVNWSLSLFFFILFLNSQRKHFCSWFEVVQSLFFFYLFCPRFIWMCNRSGAIEMRNCVTIFFVKCALFVLIQAQLNVNDPCKVAGTGSNGICRYYEDCPQAVTEIIEHGITPAKCGYQDRKDVICCALPPTPKPTRPPQSSNRISAKSKQNAQHAQNHSVSL